MKTYITEVRTSNYEVYNLFISKDKKKLIEKCKQYAKNKGYENITEREEYITEWTTCIDGDKKGRSSFIHIKISEIEEI